MITIFSNPRPFEGPFEAIQKNAIKSWLKFCSGCEIILFEDEKNTTEKSVAQLGGNIKIIKDVKRNEFGTPLINDVFKRVREESSADVLCQVNTDIILLPNFFSSIKKVNGLMGGNNFFMSGRRWDVDITESVDPKEKYFEEKMESLARETGSLHGYCGMDYWVFPKNYNLDIPPMAIGRPGMDSWLVYKTRALKIPVIDSTPSITAIHQNHNYPRKNTESFEEEKKRNLEIAGYFNMMTLQDADWIFERDELRRPGFPRNIFCAFSLFYPWRVLRGLRQNFRRIR